MKTYDREAQKQLRHLLSDVIGLCSCGSDTSWGVMLAMLERAEGHSDDSTAPSFYEPLEDLSPRAVEFHCTHLGPLGLA